MNRADHITTTVTQQSVVCRSRIFFTSFRSKMFLTLTLTPTLTQILTLGPEQAWSKIFACRSTRTNHIITHARKAIVLVGSNPVSFNRIHSSKLNPVVALQFTRGSGSESGTDFHRIGWNRFTKFITITKSKMTQQRTNTQTKTNTNLPITMMLLLLSLFLAL